MPAAGATTVPTETLLTGNPVTVTRSLTMTQVVVESALASTDNLPGYQGTCLGSSNVVPSLSAWRCRLDTPLADGTETADPCLQQPDGTLICDPTGEAFILTSADPLPSQTASGDRPAATPWVVTVPAVSEQGNEISLACLRDLTPDISIDGQAATYTCGTIGVDAGRDVLLGDLTTGDIWTAELAHIVPRGDGWAVASEQVAALGQVRIYESPTDDAANLGFAASTVIEFVPSRPEGTAEQGSCFSGSLAVTDPHAWRCTVGDAIADPCFEIPGDSGLLVCDPDPLTGDPGFPLQIAEPLPPSEVALTANGSPWLIELADGTRCGVATGATGVVDGERINYLCTAEAGQRVGLIGAPQSGLSTGDASAPLWSAKRALLAMGDDGPYATDVSWVPLKKVIRGPEQFAPLSCGGLARDVAALLGAPVVTSTVDFKDYGGSGSGLGCAVNAEGKGTDLPDVATTGRLLRAYFIDQGWRENIAYQAGGPTGEATGFQQGGGLCLVSANWAPPPGLCPNDQPIASCNVPSEERNVSISITCARDIYGVPVSGGGYALGPTSPQRVAFAPGTTETQWTGELATGQVQHFIFRVMEGQTVDLQVDAPPGSIGLSIVESPDGTPLMDAGTGELTWSSQVPATADYVIRIAARATTSYTAQLRIPAP